ncbi:hypothetical protein ABK040_000561 [Willaertia magna]
MNQHESSSPLLTLSPTSLTQQIDHHHPTPSHETSSSNNSNFGCSSCFTRPPHLRSKCCGKQAKLYKKKSLADTILSSRQKRDENNENEMKKDEEIVINQVSTEKIGKVSKMKNILSGLFERKNALLMTLTSLTSSTITSHEDSSADLIEPIDNDGSKDQKTSLRSNEENKKELE